MTSTQESVLCEVSEQGVATVTLNRPHVNNAYDGDMVRALIDGVDALSTNEAVRVILLKANGKHFQAGADLTWLNEVRESDEAENLAVSQRTTDAVRYLNQCLKPTVALVQGACFGGGTGILAACDVVIAAENAVFSIAEVRWGLHAGPIIPQLADAIGARQVRRYALTAERFDAATAKELGLVHSIAPTEALAEEGERVINEILRNGPSAVAETKRILLDTADLAIDDATAQALALSHALQRQSEEAAEGLASFQEKRSPVWSEGT